MKKLILFCLLLLIGVFCSACVNSLAVYELNEKAMQLSEDGNIDGAIARWESSVDLAPDVYESRYNLANAYIKKGQCEKAIEHAKVAQEISKNEPIADYTLAIAYDCSANNLIHTKDENDETVKITFKTKEQAYSTMKQYVDYLENANKFYDKYVTSMQNTEESANIINKINEIKEIIQTTKQEYNIQLSSTHIRDNFDRRDIGRFIDFFFSYQEKI